MKKVLVVVGKGLQAVGAQAESRQGFCKGLDISISQLSMNEEYLASVRQVLGAGSRSGRRERKVQAKRGCALLRYHDICLHLWVRVGVKVRCATRGSKRRRVPTAFCEGQTGIKAGHAKV